MRDSCKNNEENKDNFLIKVPWLPGGYLLGYLKRHRVERPITPLRAAKGLVWAAATAVQFNSLPVAKSEWMLYSIRFTLSADRLIYVVDDKEIFPLGIQEWSFSPRSYDIYESKWMCLLKLSWVMVLFY